MDIAAAQKTLEGVCESLSEAVARLTADGMDRGGDGMRALEYAQSFAELAATLECVRRNLAEVGAGLDAEPPELRRLVAGS